MYVFFLVIYACFLSKAKLSYVFRNFSYETPKNYIQLLCKSAGLLVASMMTLTCAVEFVKYLNFSWGTQSRMELWHLIKILNTVCAPL